MPVSASLVELNTQISKRLDEIVKRGRDPAAFMERVVYPLYIKGQMKRWMSEGASDGMGSLERWAPLNAKYKASKLRRFASAPGGGTKMLIASGRLYQAATGGSGIIKLVTGSSITIAVDVPYAKYVNARRNFWKFSSEFEKDLHTRFDKFMFHGKAGV